MRHSFVFAACALVCALTLSSCFIDDQGTHKDNPTNRPMLYGKIIIQDNQGLEPFGKFLAYFSHEPDSTKSLIPRYAALADLPAAPRRGEPTTQCSLAHGQVSRAAQDAFVSVGRMQLGRALQSSALEVKDDGTHQYVAQLDAGLASDAYVVAAEGAGDVPGFSVDFSLPEAPTNFRMNLADLADSGLKISKAQALLFDWPSHVLGNDRDQVVLQLITFVGNEEYLFQCASYEEDVPNAGARRVWEIPRDELTDFPTGQPSLVQVLRANLVERKGSSMDIKVGGLRSFSNRVEIEP